MIHISTLVQRLSTGKVVIFSLIVQFTLQFIIVLGTGAQVQQISGGSILDLRMQYDVTDVDRLLNQLGEQGRQIYTVNQIVDMFFILSYVLAYTTLYIYGTSRLWPSGHFLQKLWFFPLLIGGSDIIENICIFTLLGRFPEISPDLVAFASVFTTLKHILTIITLGLLAGIGASWLVRFVNRNKK